MLKIQDNKTKGILLVIIAALFWGYMGVPTKNLGDLNFDALSVSFFRTSIAAIFYILYCLIKDFTLLKIDMKGLIFFILYGIVAFGFTFICYNLSVKYISIALATMFMFSCQVWVAILSYFLFGEKFTKKKCFAIFLTLLGCFFMCKAYNLNTTYLNPKGIIFGAISGFTFALQIILAKRISSKYTQDTLLAYSFLFASLFLLPFMDIKNTVHIFKTSSNLTFILVNIFIIGVLNTVIANGAYVKSINYIDASIASVIASAELVISAIVAFIVFGQTLDIPEIFGMILVVISIILLQSKDKQSSLGNSITLTSIPLGTFNAKDDNIKNEDKNELINKN